MKPIKGQVAHGDVLITQITSIPSNAKPMEREGGRVILAHGEVTGHAHALTEKGVNAFRKEGDDMTMSGGSPAYISVEDKGTIRHEEHAPIALNPGAYEITTQREYDMIQGVRKVMD